jgi:hypothetical protein
MTTAPIPESGKNSPENNDMEKTTDDGLKDLVEEALTLPNNAQLPSKKEILNNDLIRKANREVALKYKTTPAKAFAGICCTLQAGGTSRGKRSNIKIRLGDTEFESKEINSILMKITKCSPRQIAKFLANDIVTVAEHYNITGNAFIYISRYHPHLLTQEVLNEKFWCADFQMDNQRCPAYIQNALRVRFAEKFSKKYNKGPNK